jgi:hypothetical protein
MNNAVVWDVTPCGILLIFNVHLFNTTLKYELKMYCKIRVLFLDILDKSTHLKLQYSIFIRSVGIYIVTYGDLMWLIKTWIRIGTWMYSLWIQSRQITTLVTVSSTACINNSLAVHLHSSGTNWTNLLLGPTKGLGWLGSWTPTRIAFSELELYLPWNPSCRRVLWAPRSVLKCPRVNRQEIADCHICWSVTFH